MLIKVFGAAVQGIDATLITIEVNSSRGCMFYLVGLPDSAVKESHQRIISALLVNGYKMPTSNIVVNMAPADIRKEGSAYDLPLAIGLLGANENNLFREVFPLFVNGRTKPGREYTAYQRCASHCYQSARRWFRRTNHPPTKRTGSCRRQSIKSLRSQ